jgi:hypothetical protein
MMTAAEKHIFGLMMIAVEKQGLITHWLHCALMASSNIQTSNNKINRKCSMKFPKIELTFQFMLSNTWPTFLEMWDQMKNDTVGEFHGLSMTQARANKLCSLLYHLIY